MTVEEIQDVTRDFAEAAKRAVEAGFDGVEIHGSVVRSSWRERALTRILEQMDTSLTSSFTTTSTSGPTHMEDQ